MAIADDMQRVTAARKRQEKQKTPRQKKIDQFCDCEKEGFGEDKRPFFIPSFVDVKKNIRQPTVKWGKADRDMMDDWFWKKKMEEALTEDEKDGCIQVKMGPHSFNLCSLDVDADELVEPVLDAMPFLRETLSTFGKKVEPTGFM